MTDNVKNEFETKFNDVLDEIREISTKTEKASATKAEKAELEALKADFEKLADTSQKMQASLNAPKAAETKEEKQDEYKSAFYGEYFKKGVEANLAQKALSSSSDVDGGYLVPHNTSKLITGQLFETSAMRQYANVQTISGEGLDVISDNDEAAGYWADSESAVVTDTDTPQLSKLIITAHELVAQPKATQRLLDDSSVNAEQWLVGKLVDIFSRTENAAFVNGDGINKPKGVTAYATGTVKALSADDAYTNGVVEVFKSGAAGTLGTNDGTAADNVKKFMAKLKGVYAQNGVLFCSRAMRAELAQLRGGSASGYIVSYDITKGLMIDGVPVVSFDDMANPAADAISLGFGDLSRAYQIVDRTGIRVQRDPYTEKPFVKFYTTKRVGGGVVNFEAVKLLKLSS
jgi:HK97 family phage major capsid protein